MNLKIGIAEDHPIFRKGLVDYLTSVMKVDIAFETDNTDSIIPNYILHQPDLLILDISMPGIPVFDVIETLKEKKPELKIIMLTLKEDGGTIRKCFKSGADAFICKNSPSKEIPIGIQTVMEGKHFICSKITSSIVDKIKPFLNGISEGVKMDFSEREMSIIKLIVQEKSAKEISEILNISIKTIENEKRILFNKMNCKTSIGVVKYAIEYNLVDLD